MITTILNANFDPLPIESRANGFTHKATLPYSIFTDATSGDAQQFTASIPAKTRITDMLLDLKTGFGVVGSAGNNHTTVEVGDTESATQYLSATEVNAIGLQTFSDGVTNNSTTTLTSATAGFSASDVGLAISGSGIPAGTTIAAVGSATSITMSAAATATASGVSISIAGRGPVSFKAMTGSAKTYMAADTLCILFTPGSGTALTALNTGQVDIYVRMLMDGDQIG